jgi:hypothetical protein
VEGPHKNVSFVQISLSKYTTINSPVCYVHTLFPSFFSHTGKQPGKDGSFLVLNYSPHFNSFRQPSYSTRLAFCTISINSLTAIMNPVRSTFKIELDGKYLSWL